MLHIILNYLKKILRDMKVFYQRFHQAANRQMFVENWYARVKEILALIVDIFNFIEDLMLRLVEKGDEIIRGSIIKRNELLSKLSTRLGIPNLKRWVRINWNMLKKPLSSQTAWIFLKAIYKRLKRIENETKYLERALLFFYNRIEAMATISLIVIVVVEHEYHIIFQACVMPFTGYSPEIVAVYDVVVYVVAVIIYVFFI